MPSTHIAVPEDSAPAPEPTPDPAAERIAQIKKESAERKAAAAAHKAENKARRAAGLPVVRKPTPPLPPRPVHPTKRPETGQVLNVATLASLPPDQLEALRAQAKVALWERAALTYKCHDTQKVIRQAINAAWAAGYSSFYLLCSRRLGKTYLLLLLALEQCIRQRNSRVLYLAPWAQDARNIVSDIMATILEDCPGDLAPEYKAQDREFVFGNGSVLRLKGTNGEHAQYLRGGHADLIILDECGMMDDLTHVMNDVCMPMTLTTGGKILLATTPPRTPSHDSASIYEQHAGRGASSMFTIRDAKHLDPEAKIRAMISAGEVPEAVPAILEGRLPAETTTARREYFCEFVTDASLAVVKEYTGVCRQETLVPHRKPPHADIYTAMDPGVRDRTGILYGYVDFREAKIVVEDESLLHGPNTVTIASEIRDKESDLWGDDAIYMRVSDIEKRLILDLNVLHGLAFVGTKKRQGSALGDVNLMRTMFVNRQIAINPRCVNLDRQLQNAIWNTRATDFAQAGEESIDGHYDLVAALKYLCRMVNWHHNPYPRGWWDPGGGGGKPANTWISPRKRDPVAKLGLRLDTPLARRLMRAEAKAKKRKY